MVTALHEFGHAFGLGDEYAKSSQAIGDDAAHHSLVTNMTDASGNQLPGAAVEHTGGVMSYGSDVRPQHYATFHNALETITGKQPWSLGTPSSLTATEATCSNACVPQSTGGSCIASNNHVGDTTANHTG